MQTNNNIYIDTYINTNNDSKNKIEKAKYDEEEVYRIIPFEGRYYETAEYTRKTGKYSLNNDQYFTKKDNIKYVGKFIHNEYSGFGDGDEFWGIFENDEGITIKVEYTYEGTTCFREVKSLQDKFQFKRESLDIYNEEEFCYTSLPAPPSPPPPPTTPEECSTPPVSPLRRQYTMSIKELDLEDNDFLDTKSKKSIYF